MDDYWRQFQAALNNYKETTEQRKKQFEELKAKDEANSKDIENQMKKIHRIQVTTISISSIIVPIKLKASQARYGKRVVPVKVNQILSGRKILFPAN